MDDIRYFAAAEVELVDSPNELQFVKVLIEVVDSVEAGRIVLALENPRLEPHEYKDGQSEEHSIGVDENDVPEFEEVFKFELPAEESVEPLHDEGFASEVEPLQVLSHFGFVSQQQLVEDSAVQRYVLDVKAEQGVYELGRHYVAEAAEGLELVENCHKYGKGIRHALHVADIRPVQVVQHQQQGHVLFELLRVHYVALRRECPVQVSGDAFANPVRHFVQVVHQFVEILLPYKERVLNQEGPHLLSEYVRHK